MQIEIHDTAEHTEYRAAHLAVIFRRYGRGMVIHRHGQPIDGPDAAHILVQVMHAENRFVPATR